MSLQIILGSSGAGKTRYLYEHLIDQSLKHPQIQYFAIVPEQFTMQTQKEIVMLHPNHGTTNIDIVSFQRLAYRIFEELSIQQLSVLDDIGKSMILRKVMANHKQQLDVFKRHLNQTGFIHQFKSMLSELFQYGVTPKTIRAAIPDTESPLLRAKLKNISVVYEAFEQYIEHKYITTEEILDVLCRVIPDSQMIKNSVITLDGYTGFTPVQYRVLELLMRHAGKLMVTVTMDHQEADHKTSQIQDLFYMSKQMVERLDRIAQKAGTVREHDIRLRPHRNSRFEQAPALKFLEQNLFRYGSNVYDEPQNQIEIFQAANPLKEVAYVVNQIHLLLKQEQLRYRDMAVITGDLETYKRELSFQFDQEAIPYFLDDKKSILDNPMVEWIRAMLEVVQNDFSYESMFRYLKSGLVIEPEQLETLHQLENYCLALGIKGYAKWKLTWEKELKRQPHLNLEKLNQLRERCLEPLKLVRDAFADGKVAIAAVTEALLECISMCRIEEKMKAYEQLFHNQGDYSREKEYSQIFELVIDLFSRLSELLGTEKIGKKEYREILDAGFGELKVGVIPATQDQIVIGDITRTRLDGVKVLFFVGVNDGIVPSRKNTNTLLTDAEREILRGYEIELAPTAKEDGFIQRFYLYLMMTKPSQKLILTFANLTASGKSQRPSSLLHAIIKMFPQLSIKSELTAPLNVTSVNEGKKRLLGGLREYQVFKEDPKLLELYRWFRQSQKYQKQLHSWVDAAFYSYTDQGIGKQVASLLYGEILSGSVTRLEQYAGCAYAHFLRYGLELQEKREYQLEAVDLGNLFHDSIFHYFAELERQNREWAELSLEEQELLVKSCVDLVTFQYENTIMHSSARMKYLSGKVERMTRRTIWALTEQLKRGDFIPAGLEVAFSAKDHLEAMRIPLSERESIHLKGRIDRLDLCETDDQLYVKIIDYKSGSKKFDLSELYYGLQLQLIVYLDAVMEMEARKFPGKKIVPAGVFYYQIKDPMVERGDLTDPDEVNDQILAQLKMTGLVNSDFDTIKHLDHEIEERSDVIPVAIKNGAIQERYSSVASEDRFRLLKNFVRQKAARFGSEILAGTVTIDPYKQGQKTACDYCPFHAICGFDSKNNKHAYRKLKSLKPEEVWEAIEEKD